jgi:hypothetical protein
MAGAWRRPMGAAPTERVRRWCAAGGPVCLFPAAFGVLAVLYSLVTPAWEAPDEVAHFVYVKRLLTERALPVQQVGVLGVAHHPPLYYVLAALAAWPADLSDPSGAFRPNPRFIWAEQGGRDVNAARHTTSETFPYAGHALALHLGRLVSVLLGMATVGLVVLTARDVFPERRAVWLLAGALVAFNPQFLFISAALNNDAMAALGGAGAVRATVQAWRDPASARRWLVVGVWLAVCQLAKTTTLGVVVAALAVFAVAAARIGRPRRIARAAVALAGPIVVGSGWWFVRNYALYGDPTGRRVFEQAWQEHLHAVVLDGPGLRHVLGEQFRSLWGVFGWMNVPAPGWLYAALAGLCLLGLLGAAAVVLDRSSDAWRGASGPLLILTLFALAQELFLLWVIAGCGGSCQQGRYLFPALGAGALVVAAGLARLLAGRAGSIGRAAVVGGLAATAAAVPFAVIRPAYTVVAQPKLSLLAVERPLGVPIGDSFELAGYNVLLGDGDDRVVWVRLYWRALREPDFDYSAFVHLVDQEGNLVAQKDRAPGEDRDYPPSAWARGDIIRDDRRIELPSGFRSGRYRWRIGLYNWRTGERLPVRGGAPDDAVELDGPPPAGPRGGPRAASEPL